MQGITIRGVEKYDIPRLAEILALAFNDDPVMRWATREDAKRLPALIDLYTYSIEGDLKYGEETTTEDLNACAIWLPPKAMDEKNTPLYTLSMLPHYIRWCGLNKPLSWLQFGELCQTKRPKIPHYYLDFIGVHPDKQGQGYASALLRHTLTRIDQEAQPAYLESSNPRNNPLYQRHGFQLTDEIQLPNGPKFWCMWRNPVKKHLKSTLPTHPQTPQKITG
jgi:ribosomal protein S18 acetylase RimI-like enzyme